MIHSDKHDAAALRAINGGAKAVDELLRFLGSETTLEGRGA
jgi:hypothetical protein